MSDFSTKLVSISKGNISQLISTYNGDIIKMVSIYETRAIKGVGSDNNNIDVISVIDVTTIRSRKISKTVQSKNLVYSKKSGMRFFIPRVRLVYIKLR